MTVLPLVEMTPKHTFEFRSFSHVIMISGKAQLIKNPALDAADWGGLFKDLYAWLDWYGWYDWRDEYYCKIQHLSMAEGVFPQEWKRATCYMNYENSPQET